MRIRCQQIPHPILGLCCICGEEQKCGFADQDFGNQLVCYEDLPHVVRAEQMLTEAGMSQPPSGLSYL